ncbi:hypothetical protein FRC09_018611 [Ceratobasidium sp. 395]|nr:hypothetical protein FRC09_018611 [Ceratobasidium sp. 395]
MAAPPANSNAGNMSVRDGQRFRSPAPESYVFPAEADQRYSQRSSPQVLRALDSFVLSVNGQLEPLPADWYNAQRWHKVEVVGAVASLCGPETMSVQSGWFGIVTWRWMHLASIDRLIIKSDRRFRNGELSFWLVTKSAEYAVLAPHKGYSQRWETNLRSLTTVETIPRFRRCDTKGPPPSWWDQNLVDSWANLAQRAEASQVHLKRPAPTPPEELESSPPSTPVVRGPPADKSLLEERANVLNRSVHFDPNSKLSQFAQLVWDLDQHRAPELDKHRKRAKNAS